MKNDDLNESAGAQEPDQSPEEAMKRMSRRSFAWAAVATLSTVGALKWVSSRPPAPKFLDYTGIPAPLRSILDANGEIARTLASNTNLVEVYPRSAAKPPRTNGLIGLGSSPVQTNDRVKIEGWGADRDISVEEICQLKRTELVTKFKCVEGWSSIVQAAGCRFSDFMAAIRAPESGDWEASKLDSLPKFAYLETPDKEYFVGLDMKALLHPQTLIAWEMDGKPLTTVNGAPLRLFIPTKYGIKNLKRIGLIRFQDERPDDYWFKRGYDWYAGL